MKLRRLRQGNRLYSISMGIDTPYMRRAPAGQLNIRKPQGAPNDDEVKRSSWAAGTVDQRGI